MKVTLSQNAVDEKIHNFIERKAPQRRLSDIIVDWLLQTKIRGSRAKDISYEPLTWRNHIAH